ncbi:peptidylprolyl isomerase, FKBP-type [Geotalea uraniireducens Rf4]|uniref:peptidylprolyl isomerase n=2 Tax=Geotalea uraniireducens TaxID=351604 RepID=A5G4S2_GEOUR|nr:peptidylprolyl isomerase, FKBP-type [Geotalea uraniireducens Rf4]
MNMNHCQRIISSHAVKRSLVILAAVSALAGCAGQPLKSAAVQETPPAAGTNQAASPEKANAALDEAVKSGRTTASIDLNETPGTVQKGDVVTVDYTVTDAAGKLLRTSRAAVANDPGQRLAPEEIIAGTPAAIPGLGEAVPGMAIGGKKSVKLPAEKAFGLSDPAKIFQFPTVKTISKTIRMPADEYVKQFGAFPVVGKELELAPYFKSRITAVSEKEATLEFLAKDGERFTEPYGEVQVRLDGEQISINIAPRIGAPLEVQGKRGTITAVDAASFTADFNHPLAGKDITLDLEVVSLVKASALGKHAITWLEDHDKGLSAAKENGTPAVLVLYAEWCGWCKKLFEESVQDPRVRLLSDRFVWLKVNSNKEQKFKAQYGQDGFPLIVVLDRDGREATRIDGFRDGEALSRELRAVTENLKI